MVGTNLLDSPKSTLIGYLGTKNPDMKFNLESSKLQGMLRVKYLASNTPSVIKVP